MPQPTVLETNEKGALQIPAGVLGAGPHVRFRVEHEGEAFRLTREVQGRGWDTGAGERVRAFREWVARLPKRTGPAIPAEGLRRENLYD